MAPSSGRSVASSTKGTILGVEDSAYGTVINIKNVGFIGTAHKEVEAEDGTKLEFILDGKRILSAAPSVNVRGDSLQVKRSSRIRSFQLDSLLEVRENRLYQTVALRTAARVDLNKMYPFMYAWTPTATAYCFGSDNGMRCEGEFHNSPAKVNQFGRNSMQWLAVYDQPTGKGIVSRVLAQPKVGDSGMLMVDAPGVYRKFYVMCFADDTVPAGFNATYRIVTGFLEADPTTWKTKAHALAQALKE